MYSLLQHVAHLARNLSLRLANKIPSNPITHACVRRLQDRSGIRLRMPSATAAELVNKCGRCSGTSPATHALRLPTPTPRINTFLRDKTHAKTCTMMSTKETLDGDCLKFQLSIE